MAEAATSTISVMCSCGKKLKAPASAVGKKAKCPKCGNVLTVKPPPPPPAEDDSLDALYDLAEQGEQHAASQQLAPRCPSCMREMAPNAVVCTNCGFDTRKGKAVAAVGAPAVAAAPAAPAAPAIEGTRFNPAAAAALEKSAKRGKPVEDKMAPQGPFWKGLVFSGVGAAIGAVVWIGIAYATGYWGMLPVLLVGLLAGLGMQRGQEGYSYLGGFAAAGITLVIMFVARFAVVVAIAVPMMERAERAEAAAEARTEEEKEAMRMPDFDAYDDRVVDHLFRAEIKAQKANAPAKAAAAPAAKKPADADADADEEEGDAEFEAMERQRIAAYQAVEKKLKAMPETEYKAMVAKFDKQEEASRLHAWVREEIMTTVIGVHPGRASSVEWDQAEKATKDKIAKWTPAERDAEYKRLHAQHEKKTAARIEAEKQAAAAREAARTDVDRANERATRNAVFVVGGMLILFLVFGGFWGIVLMLSALGLAYRTASGTVSD